MALELNGSSLVARRSGASPPSSDLDMLAHLAGSLSKHTLPIKEEHRLVRFPFGFKDQVDFGDGDGKRDSRTSTTTLPNAYSESIVFRIDRSSAPIHPTPPTVIQHTPFNQHTDKGGNQATVDNQSRPVKPFSHRNKNSLKLLTTLNNGGASRSLSLANSERLRRLQHSYQSTTPLKRARDIKQWSRGVAPCAPLPQKGYKPSLAVKAPPLAAAKRLAKLCLDTKPLYKHKAFLFPSIHSVPTRRTALSAPLVSKHLKGRRARADSYSSSSSSESTSHISDKMARHFGSIYDSLQGGISRLTEDLASSLHLEKTSSSTLAGYITSPSAASTYSNHSLFSEQSHISSHTNHSSRQVSESDHCMIRNAAAHPSAQRILSLHHHSPESSPKKSNVQPAPNTYRRLTLCRTNTYPPLDDSDSRYFARRNAIAPLADVDVQHQQRRGVSAFGPVRTAKSLKTARTPFAMSHLAVPVSRRPSSPPPIPSNHKMNLSYLVIPSRRSTMPALSLNGQLGSPMRLASPRHRLSECTNTDSPRSKMETDDDLDFCCKGYESPVVPMESPPRSRPSHLFAPYRRNNAASAPASQLGKRRGKMIASLELR